VVSTPVPSGNNRRPGYFVVVVRETPAQAPRGPYADNRSLVRPLIMQATYHETLPSSTTWEMLASARSLR
jgi:hypothetical protein